MTRRIISTVLSAMLLLSILAERAPAVVIGSYVGVQEVTVSAGGLDAELNNTVCDLFLPQPGDWNVFGVAVTPAPIVCRRTTVNGVISPYQCKTVDPVTYVPDGQMETTVTAADQLNGTLACIDEPDCEKWSLINTVTEASGSVHEAILATLPPGGRVLYTSDGMEENRTLHWLDGYVSQIPAEACQPQTPTFATLSSDVRASLNVFADQATPAGTGVVVSTETSFFNPITQQPVPVTVDITFGEVTQPGATMVAVQSNHRGSLGGFQLSESGFQASFLEITSTALYSGPIEVCTHYPDDDNDGFIDGSTMPETELKQLHGENGAFVDRTSRQDIGANFVCSTVEHFSPFVATVPAPCAPAPRPDCGASIGVTKQAVKISIDDTEPGKNKFKASLTFQMQNVSNDDLNTLFASPLETTAYQVCLYDENGLAFEATIPGAKSLTLEEPWQSKPTAYNFKDKTGALKGINSLRIKRQTSPNAAGTFTVKGSVKITGKGAGLPLPALPLAVVPDPPKVTLQFLSLDPLGVCINGSVTVDVNTTTNFKAK